LPEDFPISHKPTRELVNRRRSLEESVATGFKGSTVKQRGLILPERVQENSNAAAKKQSQQVNRLPSPPAQEADPESLIQT